MEALPVVWRLGRLEAEARRIIAYAEDTRAATDSYPANLSGYRFSAPWKAAYFTYSPGFSLYWWAEHPGVSHCYTPGDGFSYYLD